MIKLLVIADDYTGALDTGVQFASDSCIVKVVYQFTHFTVCMDADTDVLIYDTETRHVSPKEAYDTVYKIARYAYENAVPYIYKKTDSALRGNVGAEIEAVVDAYESEEMVFVPSFPKMNRLLRGGTLYIDGVPVSEGIFAKDPLNPVLKSGIQDILGMQTKLSVRSVQKHAVPDADGEPVIYAYDAESIDEIREITANLKEHGHLKVMAGCAGFAEVLTTFLFPDSSAKMHIEDLYPAVVLCGSLNNKSREQIDYAVEKGFPIHVLNMSMLLKDDYFESPHWTSIHKQVLDSIRQGEPIILCTEELIEEVEDSENLSARIAARLGEIGRKLISEELIRNLYIIGGDTLFGFLDSPDIQEVAPVETRNVGVVVSEIMVRGAKKNLISKSGGLGSEEAVYDIIGAKGK